MGYVQEFSITGAVGPCRMFILSKHSQLGTSLRNYFCVKCLQEPLLWKENSFQHTNLFAHICTHANAHTGQIRLASDSEVTQKCPLTFTPRTSYCYFYPLWCFIKLAQIHLLVTVVRTKQPIVTP